jgi:hypothetical protein
MVYTDADGIHAMPVVGLKAVAKRTRNILSQHRPKLLDYVEICCVLLQ